MSVKTDSLQRLGVELAKVQEQYGLLARKKLHLAQEGGQLLLRMKQEVKRQGHEWLDWLHSAQGRRLVKLSVRSCQDWMNIARQWPQIEAMLRDNPGLMDLGEGEALKLVRHHKLRPHRVKNLTPDEAQELIAKAPIKPKDKDKTHDAEKLLPMSEYRIECCAVSELGQRTGLEPDCLDLAFADCPWEEEAHGIYAEIGQFANSYLKPGRLLLSYASVLHLPTNIDGLKAQGLEYVSTFAIQYQGMNDQPLFNSVRMRNGWRPVLVFSRGKFAPQFWVDDSIDGNKKGDGDDALYWIHWLTMPGGLVASLCCDDFKEAIACRRLGRRFVGCDQVERKCKIGRERLAEVTGVFAGALYTRSRG
jgi:hypothetical protein